MAKGKYSADYRLIETFNEKGRVHTDYEYIGKPWRFDQGPDKVVLEKRLCILYCILGWIAWIGALIPNTQAMHVMYIALPFAFLAVPLALLTNFTITFYGIKEPMERRHADRLNSRYPFYCILLMIFSMIAGVIQTVFVILGKNSGIWDIVFLGCSFLLMFIGAFAFRRKDRITASEEI